MPAAGPPSFRVRGDIRVEPAGSGAVVIDLVTGRCFELNETGYFVWSLVVDGMSLEAIAARVSERYGVARDQAGTDVTDLAGALLREQLMSPTTEEADGDT